jgi:hypothetical protein
LWSGGRWTSIFFSIERIDPKFCLIATLSEMEDSSDFSWEEDIIDGFSFRSFETFEDQLRYEQTIEPGSFNKTLFRNQQSQTQADFRPFVTFQKL